MRKSIAIATVSLAALAAVSLSAQALTGAEVMARYFHAAKPRTMVMTMAMVITKNGKSLSRTMTTWGMGDNAKGEVERKLVKFLAPGDIKGSGFLTQKKRDGTTESQLWLPAMGKVRRLSSGASDQDQAFFGSDFTNRDISGFIEADFTYTLVSSSAEAYVVEAKPKAAMGFEKLVYTIDAGNFTTRKVEYLRDGKMAKTETFVFVAIGAYNLPSSIEMVSASGSSTRITISDHKVDQDFGADTFSERALKQ